MSRIRILVGTRKGAFILSADGKRQNWTVSGPHFAGWEVYHLKGSPADPNRLYASQTSSWFGQVIQRSDDGGATWAPGRQQVRLRRRAGHASVVRRHAASVGVQARLASRAVAHRSGHRSMRASRTPRCFAQATAGRSWSELPGLRGHGSGPAVGAGRRRHGPAHDPAGSDSRRTDVHRNFGGRRLQNRRSRRDVAASQQGAELEHDPEPDRRSRPLRPPHRDAQVAAGRALHAEALGRHAQRRRRPRPGAR